MTKNILSLLIGLPKTTKGFKLYVNRKKVKLVSLESDRYLITYVFINKKNCFVSILPLNLLNSIVKKRYILLHRYRKTN